MASIESMYPDKRPDPGTVLALREEALRAINEYYGADELANGTRVTVWGLVPATNNYWLNFPGVTGLTGPGIEAAPDDDLFMEPEPTQ